MRDQAAAEGEPEEEGDEEGCEDAGSAAPPEAGEGRGEAGELRSAVIEALGRFSPLLKTGLSSSLPWRLEEGRLVVPFRSGMEESVVRPSVADIAAKVSELAGKALKVELKVEPPSRPKPAAQGRDAPEAQADPVAVVERVFRGARLSDPRRGENGEFR